MALTLSTPIVCVAVVYIFERERDVGLLHGWPSTFANLYFANDFSSCVINMCVAVTSIFTCCGHVSCRCTCVWCTKNIFFGFKTSQKESFGIFIYLCVLLSFVVFLCSYDRASFLGTVLWCTFYTTCVIFNVICKICKNSRRLSCLFLFFSILLAMVDCIAMSLVDCVAVSGSCFVAPVLDRSDFTEIECVAISLFCVHSLCPHKFLLVGPYPGYRHCRSSLARDVDMI